MALSGESAVRRALASSRRGIRGTASPTAPGQGPRGWVAVGRRVPEGQAGHVGPGVTGAPSASYLR